MRTERTPSRDSLIASRVARRCASLLPTSTSRHGLCVLQVLRVPHGLDERAQTDTMELTKWRRRVRRSTRSLQKGTRDDCLVFFVQNRIMMLCPKKTKLTWQTVFFPPLLFSRGRRKLTLIKCRANRKKKKKHLRKRPTFRARKHRNISSHLHPQPSCILQISIVTHLQRARTRPSSVDHSHSITGLSWAMFTAQQQFLVSILWYSVDGRSSEVKLRV